MQSLQTIGVASEFQTDWNGRDVTPAGKARPKETPRTLPDRPRKASALRFNQRSYFTPSKKMQAILINIEFVYRSAFPYREGFFSADFPL